MPHRRNAGHPVPAFLHQTHAPRGLSPGNTAPRMHSDGHTHRYTQQHGWMPFLAGTYHSEHLQIAKVVCHLTVPQASWPEPWPSQVPSEFLNTIAMISVLQRNRLWQKAAVFHLLNEPVGRVPHADELGEQERGRTHPARERHKDQPAETKAWQAPKDRRIPTPKPAHGAHRRRYARLVTDP